MLTLGRFMILIYSFVTLFPAEAQPWRKRAKALVASGAITAVTRICGASRVSAVGTHSRPSGAHRTNTQPAGKPRSRNAFQANGESAAFSNSRTIGLP